MLQRTEDRERLAALYSEQPPEFADFLLQSSVVRTNDVRRTSSAFSIRASLRLDGALEAFQQFLHLAKLRAVEP